MQHLDRLIRQHPSLRDVDYQRLVQKAQSDPTAHWSELVRASAPIAYSMALRLAGDRPDSAAVAERATFELFAAIRADDFARLREVVGYGRWPSLLVRWLRATPALAALATTTQPDVEAPIPAVDEAVARVLAAEGERFIDHMHRVLRSLHPHDRLLLAMRYERGLTLREIDQLFRLGTPPRVASLLRRLEDSLQPIQAVGASARLDAEQRRALLAQVVRKIFATSDMQSEVSRASAVASLQR
jgi:hypothetical protein